MLPEQIIEIRETCILGDKQFGAKALAKIYGITDVAVLNIVHFRTYTEIGGRREVRYSGLSDEDKQWICEHYIKGDPEFGQRPLARKFGVDKTTIRYVVEN